MTAINEENFIGLGKVQLCLYTGNGTCILLVFAGKPLRHGSGIDVVVSATRSSFSLNWLALTCLDKFGLWVGVVL